MRAEKSVNKSKWKQNRAKNIEHWAILYFEQKECKRNWAK